MLRIAVIFPLQRASGEYYPISSGVEQTGTLKKARIEAGSLDNIPSQSCCEGFISWPDVLYLVSPSLVGEYDYRHERIHLYYVLHPDTGYDRH